MVSLLKAFATGRESSRGTDGSRISPRCDLPIVEVLNLNSCALARRMSTIIYLVHMYFVVVFVYGICGQSNPDLYASNVNRPLLFLFTLSGSIIVSTLVIGVSKRMPIIKAAFGI